MIERLVISESSLLGEDILSAYCFQNQYFQARGRVFPLCPCLFRLLWPILQPSKKHRILALVVHQSSFSVLFHRMESWVLHAKIENVQFLYIGIELAGSCGFRKDCNRILSLWLFLALFCVYIPQLY